MDLNATMPHRQDQLAKVSSSAFISTVMADLLPSLGTMKNTELFISFVAFAILVITVISNVCIQMGYFCFLDRTCFHSAHHAYFTCNSVFFIFGYSNHKVLLWSLKFCDGESDYKWSTTMVLISQTIAVGIGTIAPAVRWFMAINFSSSNKAKQACNRELGVEIYWIKKLLVWQLQPLDFKICGHHGRKLVHRVKYQTFRLFIGLQKGIVFSCQIIRFISIFFVGRFLDFKRFIRCKNSISSNESELGSLTNLSRFVIHLGGEEELVDLIMKNNGDATDHWIKIGEKQKPEDLIVEKLLEKLVEKVDSSSAFTGVGEFDNDSVPSLGFAEPPNCWGLPVVTLTSIALALPSIDQELIKLLVSSVHEGLKYIREIESNLDEKINLKNVRMAEEIVWSGVELDRKWLDVDLRDMGLQGKGIKETIKSLSDISKIRFIEYGEKHLMHTNEWFQKEEPTRWCIRMLAANSMYRICETLLLSPENEVYECSQRLFEKLLEKYVAY